MLAFVYTKMNVLHYKATNIQAIGGYSMLVPVRRITEQPNRNEANKNITYLYYYYDPKSRIIIVNIRVQFTVNRNQKTKKREKAKMCKWS